MEKPGQMWERIRVVRAGIYRFLIQSRSGTALAALAAFLLIALLKFTVSGALVRDGASELEMRSQDALFTGLFTAIIVWIALSAARFRRDQIRAQVRVVSDLNHHLRNALSVILNSHLLPENAQTAAILESVERIDSALDLIVPNVGVINGSAGLPPKSTG
jgi:hypothetical protein